MKTQGMYNFVGVLAENRELHKQKTGKLKKSNNERKFLPVLPVWNFVVRRKNL